MSLTGYFKYRNKTRSCRHKQKFNSHGHALAGVRAAKANLGEDMEPYKCRHCDGWHIGHHNKKFSGTKSANI